MATKFVVAMNSQGRITVPAAARAALRVAGETQFEMEVRDNELILRPALVIPREDAWAYTPENMASILRARQQVRAGRLRQASVSDLGSRSLLKAEEPAS